MNLLWLWAVVIAAAVLVIPAIARLYLHMTRIEPQLVEVTRHEVSWPDLPPELDGLTLCQISDPHVGFRTSNLQAVAAAIRGVKADLWLFTGDMILGSGGMEAFLQWFDDLGGITLPAIAILGNAEHKEGLDLEGFVSDLESRAIRVFRNESGIIRVRSAEIQVVGVDDPHSDYSDFKSAYECADAGRWTLLLCHSPDGLAEMRGDRADLMLCGHTHGGQICFPLLGPVVANTRWVQGFVAGWYEGRALGDWESAMRPGGRLFVSRGLGMNGVQCRLLCRPELAVFTLRRTA